MDRRRFVPSPEGLEVRTMLSATSSGLGGLTVSPTATSQSLPITFQQKQARIDKLPGNLRALQRNRFLPADTVAQIQQGLGQLMGTMKPPVPQALTNYNLAMRKIAFHSSLSTSDVQTLDRAFRAVLRSAHAPEPALTKLADAVNHLVTQVDTASMRPVFLATNDNAYILQLATVLGQRMPAPRVPSISRPSGKQVNPRVSVTPLSHPSFIGSYESRTTIQLVDSANGKVIGTAAVATNGQYTVKTSTPLAIGRYTLFVRAVDEAGHVSNPSRTFGVQVVAPR